ncbi:alanine-trna ligase [Nannochloropsis oceanica]
MVVMLFTVATRTCRGFLVPYPGQRAGVLNRAAGASLMRRHSPHSSPSLRPALLLRMSASSLSPPSSSSPSSSFSAENWPVNRVRQTFIDYFIEKHGHSFVPSSPVVPLSDPTLLFTNAGMNQFKPIFLGQADPNGPLAKLEKAVNTQKCIRAGGKHNDLEDVGMDTYHHTFFEMLGSWSFGNYFKQEAIAWSWDLLTNVYALPADRLYVTYFGGDDSMGVPADEEARDLWLRFLPPDRVLPFGKKDNFWEMGDTGPCGPCSEIHYDRVGGTEGGRDAAKLVNADDPDVLEIWNLVFIQYNREAAGEGAGEEGGGGLRLLPSQHVDTGMGLERLVSVLQNKKSNYDSDAFMPLFAAIEKDVGCRPYAGKLGKEDVGLVDTAYRVVADHARTLTFAIADGALPSNEGRGYVLRRVLRRAVRYGKQMLGARPGFFARLVPCVVREFGQFYPELKEKEGWIQEVIEGEEKGFGEMLERGIKYFGEEVVEGLKKEGGKVVSAEKAFFMYDTLGFPVDLTRLMALEEGLEVDVEGFGEEMEKAKQRSRDAALRAKAGGEGGGRPLVLRVDETAWLQAAGIQATEDEGKYVWEEGKEGKVVALFTHEGFKEEVGGEREGQGKGMVGVVLDSTSFYAEAGGQVADTGRLVVGGRERGMEMEVLDVQVFAGYVLHICRLVEGGREGGAAAAKIKVGEKVACHVDYERRRRVAPNHTMTHVLNFALREVLGDQVAQRGSLVNDEKLRFDFSHGGAMAVEEMEKVEAIVRGVIEKKLPVTSQVVGLEAAKGINGLRAVFGEVYPDRVRVIAVGEEVETLLASPEKEAWAKLSVEFCGGTHVRNTEEAQSFVLVEETAVAKGVRRVTGVTGEAAQAAIEAGAALSAQVKAAEEGPKGVELEGKVVELRQALDGVLLSASLKPRLRKRIDDLGKKAAAERKAAAQAGIDQALSRVKGAIEEAKSQSFLVLELAVGLDSKAVKRLVETSKNLAPGLAVLVVSREDDGKALAFAHVPPEKAGHLPADKWVAATLAVVGGRGGGKAELAQGQAKDVAADQVQGSVKAAQAFASEALAKSLA